MQKLCPQVARSISEKFVDHLCYKIPSAEAGRARLKEPGVRVTRHPGKSIIWKFFYKNYFIQTLTLFSGSENEQDRAVLKGLKSDSGNQDF